MPLPSIKLLAPAPNAVISVSSGNTYTADGEGRLTAVSTDLRDLFAAGCVMAGAISTNDILLGTLIGANMNSTADQAIPLVYLPSGVSWQARRITVRNASVSLTTAAGGIYTAASKGGTALVAAAQAYAALTAPAKCLDLTFATNITNPATLTQLYLSLTTAQGVAATADVYVYGELVF